MDQKLVIRPSEWCKVGSVRGTFGRYICHLSCENHISRPEQLQPLEFVHFAVPLTKFCYFWMCSYVPTWILPLSKVLLLLKERTLLSGVLINNFQCFSLFSGKLSKIICKKLMEFSICREGGVWQGYFYMLTATNQNASKAFLSHFRHFYFFALWPPPLIKPDLKFF